MGIEIGRFPVLPYSKRPEGKQLESWSNYHRILSMGIGPGPELETSPYGFVQICTGRCLSGYRTTLKPL